MLRRTPLKVRSRLKAKSKLKAKKRLRQRSTRKKKYDAELEKVKPIVKERDGYRCILCGRPYEEIHHISYRSSAGGNEIKNLCCLCWHCHRIKIHQGSCPKEYKKLLQQILSERYGYEY